MEEQRLKQALEQLHAELSQAKHIDPESLALLRTVTDDIQQVLNKRGMDDVKEEAEPLKGNLRDLLLKFEADHPELAVTIGKIADGLAAMGI